MPIQIQYLSQHGHKSPIQQQQLQALMHVLQSERPSFTRQKIQQRPSQEVQRIALVQSKIQIPKTDDIPSTDTQQAPRFQFQETIPMQVGNGTQKIKQKAMQLLDSEGLGSNSTGNFRLFLGLKFCNVGWSGMNCDQPLKKFKCNSRDDRCFYHPDYGTAVVSRKRWEGAQAVEQQRWKKELGDMDRNDGHKVIISTRAPRENQGPYEYCRMPAS